MMPTVFVTGIGLWATGYRSASAWVAGERNETELEPACALLPSRLARRTSLLTRMAIDVVSQAGSRANLATVPTVFGSAYGETETLNALLEQLCVDGELSPTKFHNSVYNTASGYFTIAAVNKAFTTTIAAGPDTWAMALLEAMSLLAERGGEVIVAVADEAPSAPLQTPHLGSLAAAVHLTITRPDDCFGELRNLRVDLQAPDAVIPAELRANAVGSVLPLIRTLQLREGGVIPLSHDGGAGWTVEVVPVGGAR